MEAKKLMTEKQFIAKFKKKGLGLYRIKNIEKLKQLALKYLRNGND